MGRGARGWEVHLTAVIADDESHRALHMLLSPRICYAYGTARALARTRRQGAFAFGVARPGAKSIIAVARTVGRRPFLIFI